MTANLFVIANVKQLRTYVVLEFYCLFPNILWCWRHKFSKFLTVFTIGLSLARFWRAFRISGGFEQPIAPRYTTDLNAQLNPISILMALLGAHYILHVNRIRVNFFHFL